KRRACRPASHQARQTVVLSTGGHLAWPSSSRVSFKSAQRVSFKSASTKLGAAAVGWLRAEVEQWINERAQARAGSMPKQGLTLLPEAA
ncbi:MAG: AlpA family phage regulatory protein, partial [Pseudomonadota bacterium]|nr:AlpA family phage regulatory protein [Pseudomonadota bacterium]